MLTTNTTNQYYAYSYDTYIALFSGCIDFDNSDTLVATNTDSSDDITDNLITVEKKAKALGLFVYEYDGGAVFWDLQISETQWVEMHYGSAQEALDIVLNK